jgi:hypothetical protein
VASVAGSTVFNPAAAATTAAALAASDSDPIYDTPYTAMRAVWPDPCLLELLCQQAKCVVDYHLTLPTAVAGHNSSSSSRGGSSRGSAGEAFPGREGGRGVG